MAGPAGGGRPAIWRSSPQALLVLAVAALTVAAVLLNRSLWLDEAMLYLAVEQDGIHRPGQPLSLFEQSLPYGTYLIYEAAVALVGSDDRLLRVPSLVAYAGGLLLLYRTCRSVADPLLALLSTAMAAFGWNTVVQATSLKHYSFEFAATVAVLWAGRRLALQATRRAAYDFLLVALLALAFSNSAQLVAAASLSSCLLAGGVTLRRRLLGRELWGYGVAAAIGAGAWYLLVSRPATAFQLSAIDYGRADLRTLSGALLDALSPTLDGSGGLLVSAGVWLILAVGALLSPWHGTSLQRVSMCTAAILLVLCALLTVSGVAPFLYVRHVTFVVPVVAVALAAALQSLGAAARSRRRGGRTDGPVPPSAVSTALVAAVVVVASSFGVRAASTPIEEVGDVVRAAARHCSASWVYYGAQPATAVYAPRHAPDMQLLGLVGFRSGSGQESWIAKARADYESSVSAVQTQLRSQERPCLIFGHVRQDLRREVGMMLQATSDLGGRCCTLRRAAVEAALYTCGKR